MTTVGPIRFPEQEQSGYCEALVAVSLDEMIDSNLEHFLDLLDLLQRAEFGDQENLGGYEYGPLGDISYELVDIYDNEVGCVVLVVSGYREYERIHGV